LQRLGYLWVEIQNGELINAMRIETANG